MGTRSRKLPLVGSGFSKTRRRKRVKLVHRGADAQVIVDRAPQEHGKPQVQPQDRGDGGHHQPTSEDYESPGENPQRPPQGPAKLQRIVETVEEQEHGDQGYGSYPGPQPVAAVAQVGQAQQGREQREDCNAGGQQGLPRHGAQQERQRVPDRQPIHQQGLTGQGRCPGTQTFPAGQEGGRENRRG